MKKEKSRAPTSSVPDRYLHNGKRDAFKAFATTLATEKEASSQFVFSTLSLLGKALEKPTVLKAFEEGLKDMPQEVRRWQELGQRIGAFSVNILSAPSGIRTRVAGLKGQRPWPD